jgi:hypothetical protein
MEFSNQFKIGQKVICIDVKTIKGYEVANIKKGGIYSVSGISNCSRCGINTVFLHGLGKSTNKNIRVCTCCFNPIGENEFFAYRFKPINYKIIDNSLLIGKIIEEKIECFDTTELKSTLF